MGYLLLAFFSTFLMYSTGILQRDNTVSSLQYRDNAQQQQAAGTVRYLNALIDYLYVNPVVSGSVNDSLLESEPPPGVKHRIENSRLYVYQPAQRGLVGAMRDISGNSALIGIVKNRQLIDLRGLSMQVHVPDIIPDTYLVYIH